MSFKISMALVTLGLVVASGCKKKEEPAKEEAKAAATAPAASEKTPEQKLDEEVEQLAGQLDMPEDYIASAEEEINDGNLEAELAKLEKEVEAEVKASGIKLPDLTSKAKPAGSTTPSKPPAPVNKAPVPANNH